MATYKEILDDVRRQPGQSVKTCWIAHVKELNGLNPRMAVNRFSPVTRKRPCPENIRPLIEESMRRLGVLK
jgi:hypothetical protein